MTSLLGLLASSSETADSLRVSEVWGVWVGGAGAALAAFVAIGLATWEVRRARQERKRAAEFADSEQATHVYAWIETNLSELDGRWYSTVYWQNGSQYPIWDFYTEVSAFNVMRGEFDVKIVRRFLPPGPVQSELVGQTLDYGEGSEPLTCRFRDVRGTRWLREPNGWLHVTGRLLTVFNARDLNSPRYILAWWRVSDGLRRAFPRLIKHVSHSWYEAPRQYRNAGK